MKFRLRSRVPSVDAIQLQAPCIFSNGAGDEEAQAGDYLVQSKSGEQYILPAEEFEATYERVAPPGRKSSKKEVAV